jgi:hypothetical protein
VNKQNRQNGSISQINNQNNLNSLGIWAPEWRGNGRGSRNEEVEKVGGELRVWYGKCASGILGWGLKGRGWEKGGKSDI